MTTADATGLTLEDLGREAERFGVAEEQVRRDHLISHALAAISASCADDVTFFGGTALSRTHLAHARLSEDIDLIATTTRSEVLPRLILALEQALMRTHGRPVWTRAFTDRDADAAVMSTAGVQVQLQLLRGEHYSVWPVERVAVEQRYSDAPPAILTVPTLASFSGWKTAAWNDRGAPRDLYDLWALDRIGALTADAADLFALHGTTGHPPRAFMFAKAPTQRSWVASLSGQTRLTVTAEQALTAVRRGWSRALGEDWA
jgi:predicted nucleotidyltransferase component of viral defense system